MRGAHFPNTAGARSPHQERRLATARAVFVEFRGEDEARIRDAAIQALPIVEWKGRQLRTIRCHGTTGNGSHLVNVPESLLWSLIEIRQFYCPYHPRELQGEP